MLQTKEYNIADEAQTVSFGQRLSKCITPPVVIYLIGNLGAGKTCLARAMLRSWGIDSAVRSPTFTLVENYDLPEYAVYHFDLYRISDPAEVAYLGMRDYLHEKSICLIEWPEHGEGEVPAADLAVEIQYEEEGRNFLLKAYTNAGKMILHTLDKIND